MLERADLDEIAIEDQARAVPDETVHAIAEEWNSDDVVAVGAGLRDISAFGLRRKKWVVWWWRRRVTTPVQIHRAIRRKCRIERHAEESALGSVVDREIQRGTAHCPTRYMQHAAGVL